MVRWYTVLDPFDTEPVRLPSVTSILDLTMAQSRRDTLVRAEMANPVDYTLRREQALASGIAVDSWAKRSLLLGKLQPVPHPVARQCRRLIPLVRGILKMGEEFWCDEKVYDIEAGYAGTLDIVATLPAGFRACIELKSSAYTIWPEAVAEAQLQTVAYGLAWNQLHPDTPINAIASFHVTPYMLHPQVTVNPTAIRKLEGAWKARHRLFASRFNQMEL